MTAEVLCGVCGQQIEGAKTSGSAARGQTCASHHTVPYSLGPAAWHVAHLILDCSEVRALGSVDGSLRAQYIKRGVCCL